MADARQAMLQTIQRAKGGASSLQAAQTEWAGLERTYQRTAKRSREAIIALMEDRLRDYDAKVERVTEDDLPTAIARALQERIQVIAPQGLPSEWLESSPRIVVDRELSIKEMDACDSVLTASTLAIAETGTIVLQNVPGQGRRAISLVPDFHLCVLRVEDIVETVPEAFARLGTTAMLPTTFISGPSATADIEMTRIKGVHGPRFLHVLLVNQVQVSIE